jgi:FkbM family methyltransferase
MATLDSLAPAETSVVKIDVEGYELQVMRGRRENPSRHSPFLGR